MSSINKFIFFFKKDFIYKHQSASVLLSSCSNHSIRRRRLSNGNRYNSLKLNRFYIKNNNNNKQISLFKRFQFLNIIFGC
jgi:hypothetical protein